MEEELNTDCRYVSVCVACLSSNRMLSPLNEYSSIYHKLFNSCLLSSEDVRLCWECVATLKKIKKFKAKVDEAQKLLFNFYSFGQNRAPRCLSNLGITVLPENTIIKIEEGVEISVIVEEIREMEVKVIKEELDNCSDVDDICAEYSDNLDNDLTLLDAVKKEEFESLNDAIKEEIAKTEQRKTYMTRKIPSSKLFRPVASKAFSEKRTKYASYDLRNLRKLIPIKERDLRQWIEKQKNEEYYKNFKLKCTTCVQAWTTKPSLTKHMMQHHDKSVGHLICDVCQCRFRSKAAITKHINKHYFIQQCNICSYRCYTSQGMRWHVTMHKKVVECLQCGECFPSRILFRRHYVATHDVFICDYCGKRCHSKQKLENHIRRKHQTGFRCGECGKQFKRLWSLTEHTRLRHETRRSDEAYCAPCDAQFDNVHQYERHVRRSAAHARERPDTVKAKVPCPSCDRVYCRKTFMMNHYRHVHLNQSKYYCADCDKGFLNSTKFVDHRSYFHEGKVKEKNKLCNICGRGFAATRTLVNHIRTHTGERPYECDYCTAKFTQKHAMVSHVKYIHLKNKRGASWKQ